MCVVAFVRDLSSAAVISDRSRPVHRVRSPSAEQGMTIGVQVGDLSPYTSGRAPRISAPDRNGGRSGRRFGYLADFGLQALEKCLRAGNHLGVWIRKMDASGRPKSSSGRVKNVRKTCRSLALSAEDTVSS